VTSHAEADGRIVDLLVKDGVAGLIVAGTGNGTVHQSLAQALDRARRAGVKIKRCTRITSAGLAPIETQSDPEATPLTAAQARIALQLELLKNGDNC
jgi:L-asparaginase